MKKYTTSVQPFLIALVISLAGSPLLAQPGEHMERFRQERVSFFNEKLGLSEDEAKLFWPVHEDLHNRNMKINEDEKNLLKYYNSNFEAMSDEEIDQTIEKFLELQKKRVENHREYHEKFVEIIGKKKTMRMYALDREFRMHILQKFRGGNSRGQGHRGGR